MIFDRYNYGYSLNKSLAGTFKAIDIFSILSIDTFLEQRSISEMYVLCNPQEKANSS